MGGEIFQHTLILKNLQIRQRRSAAKLITGVAMPMEKRFILPILAQKGIKNFLGRQRCGQRQVATGQSLGHRHQIRHYSLVFTGKHRPGPPEAGHYLVRNEQSVGAESANLA